MRHSILEVAVGAVVLAVAAGFLAFAATRVDAGAGAGGAYELVAKFRKADGIAVGTDVRLSGVKVGSVSRLTLEQSAPERVSAVVTLSIRSGIELPTGTNAKIVMDGLLGGSLVSLEPACDAFADDGGCPVLKPGDEIVYTTGAVDLLTLLGAMASGGRAE